MKLLKSRPSDFIYLVSVMCVFDLLSVVVCVSEFRANKTHPIFINIYQTKQ
jgi:hypothetical protein